MEKRGQDRDPVEAFSINEYADARIKRVCSAKLDVDSFHERRVSAVLFIFRCCWRIWLARLTRVDGIVTWPTTENTFREIFQIFNSLIGDASVLVQIEHF